MYNWKNVVRNYLVVAPVCAICGAVIASTILPIYIWLDVIHEWGLRPPRSDKLSTKNIHFLFYSLVGCGFLLGLYLTCLRNEIGLSLFLYIALCPTWFFSLFAGFLTDTKGIWYRGGLNGLCWLSLPIWHWLLAVAMVRRIPQREILK